MKRLAALVALLCAGGGAAAQAVSMAGSLGSNALLVIDGKPRNVAIGATVDGIRLVSVTGKLQNAKGVIHVVANRVDDLTPLLGRLSEHGHEVESLARCDEVKRPDPGNRSAKNLSKGAHPRRGDSLVRLLREQPELADELLSTHHVMPKGRNFH